MNDLVNETGNAGGVCTNNPFTDIEQENMIFSSVVQIIEKRKHSAALTANGHIVLMFWEIGQYINSVILGTSRAEYGKKILSTVSTKLVETYGNAFVEANLYRMKRFATVFADVNSIADFIPFLSWSHFCEIMRIKDPQARLFYAKDAAQRQLGVRDLRHFSSRLPKNCDNLSHYCQRKSAASCCTFTDEKMQRCVALLPWRHNILIMSEVKSLAKKRIQLTKNKK
jgi:hypothetical protein